MRHALLPGPFHNRKQLEINKVTLLKKQVISGIGCDTLFLRNRDEATQKIWDRQYYVKEISSESHGTHGRISR
jgi:hypothetical protein